MKIGVIGNTKLTFEGLQLLVSLNHQIPFVFGLSDVDLKSKVNSMPLDDFCKDNNIMLYKSEKWDIIMDQDVDLIISLGDSRFVPPQVIDKFKVIGNHGAVLPLIQGGASLVWGRMLNSGEWGVSLMELDKKIDNGTILKTKSFTYEPNTPMEVFCDKCDKETINILKDYLINGSDNKEYKSSRVDIKVSKYIDSKTCIGLLQFALENNLNIYLPPRTPEDGKIKKEWENEFIENFKIANDKPYLKCYY
jgi:methionyl-tRNA formyltransferase